jgi:hypothetical protein
VSDLPDLHFRREVEYEESRAPSTASGIRSATATGGLELVHDQTGDASGDTAVAVPPEDGVNST